MLYPTRLPARLFLIAAALLAARCSEKPTGNPVAPGCAFTVAVTTPQFGPAGGSATASITAPDRCAWTATSSADWITLQGPASGSGSGTVAMTVAAFDGGDERTGQLTIAMQTVTVKQSGCSVQLGSSEYTFGDQGGVRDLQLGAPQGCRWAVEGIVPWTAIEPSSGTGSATVRLRVLENNEPGKARQAMLTIGNQHAVITQGSEPECQFTLESTTQSFAQSGGEAAIRVGTRTGCRWTLQSDAAWVGLIDGSTGQGAASIRILVAPNADAEDRRARLNVNGTSLEITQIGWARCEPRVEPVEQLARLAGDTGEFTVTAEPGCAWTARSTASWIRMRGETRGVGSGRVAYSVEAGNTSPAYYTDFLRQAPIEVRWAGPTAGQNVWIRQFPQCTGANFRSTPIVLDAGANVYRETVLTDSPFTCPWTLVPPAESWITVRFSSVSRQPWALGDGMVHITLQPNPSASPRSAQFLVAERPMTVIQEGRK